MRERLLGVVVEAGVTAGLIAGLWVYTDHAHSFYITGLGEVLRVFRRTWLFADFSTDVIPSLIRFAVGFSLSVIIGVAAGFFLARRRVLYLALQPLMTFARATPPPALLPIFIVLIGIGTTMKIVVIASVCVWPILLNTIDGLAGLDETMLQTASIYRIRPVDRFLYVTAPAVSPRVFAGARTSLSIAILILVVSEMIGSANGIGYFILQAQQSLSIPQMWAGVLLLGLLGYGLNAAFTVVERRVLHWYILPARRDR